MTEFTKLHFLICICILLLDTKFIFFVVAGRDRDETEMIRKAVDAALDQLERRQQEEEMTDMKQIKEEIFLEIAKRLEQAKIDTAEVRQLLI